MVVIGLKAAFFYCLNSVSLLSSSLAQLPRSKISVKTQRNIWHLQRRTFPNEWHILTQVPEPFALRWSPEYVVFLCVCKVPSPSVLSDSRDKWNRCFSSAPKHGDFSQTQYSIWSARQWNNGPGQRHRRNLPCLSNSTATAKSEVQPAVQSYSLPKEQRTCNMAAPGCVTSPQSPLQRLLVRPRYNVTRGFLMPTFRKQAAIKQHYWPEQSVVVCQRVPVISAPGPFYLCDGATWNLCGSAAPRGERLEIKVSADGDLHPVDCA